uniref:Uncharacterized protein n=1 Tax=Heliothis virescens TaxID=7102 RepID=A0A2A4IWS6_HELVI
MHHFVPNVGTVLFTDGDLHKKQWSKTELGLLQARRYFQTLLPPPIFINTFNEDYVNILLGYFRDAYAAIRRESVDPETDTIMTTALSDAIGGYLKVWVLPIAKLDYYGGTVSQHNVVKLFQFYNEIKRYLDTDGTGWHKPDENVLNSITINVAPLKLVSNTRSMKDPCENLAYFEKTPGGLSIPIPNVNWNDKSSTMFIPLKNVSLISMNKADSAHNLIKYYDAARSCIQTTNPKEQEKFDEKFQDWLSNEVVPHLKDEDLYLALGSVLTLVNRTRDLCNTVMDMYGDKYNVCLKKPPKVSAMDLSCKKMWIITIILLIEIAWCVPALIYILCSKKMHKKDCSSNVYLFIDSNKTDKKDKSACFKAKTSCMTECAPADKSRSGNTSCVRSGIKIYHRKSQNNNVEFEGQYPSKVTNAVGTELCSDPSRDQPCDGKCNVAECHKSSTKSSLKKNCCVVYSNDHCNLTQFTVLSSHDAFYPDPKQSGTSMQTPLAPSSSQTLEELQKSRRRREKEEYRRHEKQRNDDPHRNERRKTDESKKQEDRRKAEECRKQEACKKAEENRKFEESRKLDEAKKLEECRRFEERRKADECRRIEERRKAEECKKLEKLDECRNVVEYRRLEKPEESNRHKSPDEYRKLQDRKQVEERRKLQESRKLDEIRKRDECRDIDESKKLEDRRKAEEYRRHKKPEHSKKVVVRNVDENKMVDECRKLEEARESDEFEGEEERRGIDEYILEAESKDYCEDKNVCRLFDECRDLHHLDDSRRRDERCCMRTEDSCIVSEIKYDKLESAPEYSAFDETYDVVESLDDTACRKPCPCTDCITKGCFDSTSNSTCREVTSDSIKGSKCQSDKQVETKTTRFQVTRELRTIRTSGKQSGKIPSGKPYLEITIDRPAREICVDMSRQQNRPSKIPKPASSVAQPLSITSKHPSTSYAPGEKHKSMIPQLKKKTLDDMAITHCRCTRSSASSRLNDTF